MEESTRLCCCSKDEFSPESPTSSSFKSWASYCRALKETGRRLRDRITARSLADAELNEVRARSGPEMKKSLTWWDLVLFGIGSVIGAGVFVLTGLQAREVTGPSVVLSFAVSGLSAMLSVFCYGEFAVEIPVAGPSRKRSMLLDGQYFPCFKLKRMKDLSKSGRSTWKRRPGS